MLKFRLWRRICSLAAACTALGPILLLAQPAAAQSLAPIWSGVYAGVHGGGRWSEIDTSDLGSPSDSALGWGIHAGYNVRLGGLVAGIEGDANFEDTDISFASAGGGSASFSSDWSGSVRARLGLPIGPALLFGTLGYAWNSATFTALDGAGGRSRSDTTYDGIVYGIGAESYVLPNVSLRLEALHFDYAKEKLSLGAIGGVTEIDPSDTVLRAGITFHLN